MVQIRIDVLTKIYLGYTILYGPFSKWPPLKNYENNIYIYIYMELNMSGVTFVLLFQPDISALHYVITSYDYSCWLNIIITTI